MGLRTDLWYAAVAYAQANPLALGTEYYRVVRYVRSNQPGLYGWDSQVAVTVDATVANQLAEVAVGIPNTTEVKIGRSVFTAEAPLKHIRSLKPAKKPVQATKRV